MAPYRRKLKTSYFAKPGIQENPDALSIALYAPRWWGKGRRFKLLAPTPDMLKQGYTKEEYFNLLDERINNPAEIYEQINDKIICCWEKDGSKCHRRYAAEWFEAKLPGIEIPEVE
jgi:hypothetical protein